MNVSMDVGTSYSDFGSTYRKVKSPEKDFGGQVNNLAADPEEKKGKGQSAVTFSFPNQLSAEEQQKVDALKNQAMQIAAQAKEGLSSGQMAQIKAIEQQIGKITGMPMSENLGEAAKKVAEQAKAENQLSQDMEEVQSQQSASQMGEEKAGDMSAQSGTQMLQQKASMTAIKMKLGGMGSKKAL